MIRASVVLAVLLGSASMALAQNAAPAAPAPKMTYQEAKSHILNRELPPFWIGDVKDLGQRLDKLQRGKVTTIAKSPGGRPIYLATFGELEKLERDSNFNSAVGGRDLTAYMNKSLRKKPVIYFIGPVHGHEVEGLTGLMNLIEVMETGHDLRGKDQPELRKLGDQCRLVIIPSGNPDGTARFEPRTLNGMENIDLQFWGMGTWADDRIAIWPDSKRQHPRTGPKIGFMGCYFNDIGINPMHDEFFFPMSTEAPAILRVAMDEGPDLTASLHSCAWDPAILRPAFMPVAVQQDVADLAARYYKLLESRGLTHNKDPLTPKAEGEGKGPLDPFNLISAVYHISGSSGFTLECPHGVLGDKPCQVTLSQIVDIQLSLYEAMMKHELELKTHAK
jgi:hypothetical protein